MPEGKKLPKLQWQKKTLCDLLCKNIMKANFVCVNIVLITAQM